MGTVTSTIYSTTAKEPMTQLDFSTDFQESTASVTINLVKSGTVVATKTYSLSQDKLIDRINIVESEISSEGTITLATNGHSVVFSGICVWKNVTSFKAENVAVAYR